MTRTRTISTISACAIAATLAFIHRADAQPYGARWHTVDGGGATPCAGSTFELSGTIGQHDASGPMAGVEFKLVGGFWSGSAASLDGGSGDAGDGDQSSNGDDSVSGASGSPGDGAIDGDPIAQSQPTGQGAPDCGAGVCGAGSSVPLMLTGVAGPLRRRRCIVALGS